ncbi:SlyX family protein [uncultured Oxalicibacterium sp.]|uniref:SlyX family protein n=1 Tax=uncultured Oxalicibacterium sp. TaxID=1168540 RepID=UPI0025E1325B|nr:SlyX family protein [uncultured Oxalicibacterium sp.]
MNEERLVDIEIKLASQDDLLDVLNKTVYEQQKKIDELETLCVTLARRLIEIREEVQQKPLNEPPPHY